MVYNLSHVGLCIYFYVCTTNNVESICKKTKAFSRGKVKCNFKMKKIFSNLIKMIKITKSRNFVFSVIEDEFWTWRLVLKVWKKVFVESLSSNVLETILLVFLLAQQDCLCLPYGDCHGESKVLLMHQYLYILWTI